MTSDQALLIIQRRILVLLSICDPLGGKRRFSRDISETENLPLDVVGGILKDFYSRGYVEISQHINGNWPESEAVGYSITPRGMKALDDIDAIPQVGLDARVIRMTFLKRILKRTYR